MKKLLTILLCLPLCFACQDERKSNTSEEENSSSTETAEVQRDSAQNTTSNSSDSTTENSTIKKITAKDFSGEFQRSDDGKESTSCDCNCLSIQMNQASKLCLDQEENIHIQVKFKQTDASNLVMYYVSGQGKMEGQKDIPWSYFDTDQALATLHFTTPNSFELDWKGFIQNGEIAMDYAVLGKKNLEGNYKRK